MKTLADAWTWYTAARRSLIRMRRLGERHWADPSLASTSIRQDEQFKVLEANDIIAETELGLLHIDDLAVVVLFSVFEACVRQFLIELIVPHAANISDPILIEAAGDAMRGVEEGSFYRRVLEPLKKQGRVSAELITQIDQIRHYRNWVAHGRREAPTNNVTPSAAYDRLDEFLKALGIAAESK